MYSINNTIQQWIAGLFIDFTSIANSVTLVRNAQCKQIMTTMTNMAPERVIHAALKTEDCTARKLIGPSGTARVDRAPTYRDLEVAELVHRALGAVQHAGRFGDRKVFISALWAMMLHLDAATGGHLTEGCTLEHFKAWLVGALRVTRDGREDSGPLVVLARADLVAAMDPSLVAASETVTDGATYHFVLDPAVARDVYAPRAPVNTAFVPTIRGRVGASR
ncbi:MAG TPA: hypothetical protein VF469_30195 [Kofleriaceae bacterium]